MSSIIFLFIVVAPVWAGVTRTYPSTSDFDDGDTATVTTTAHIPTVTTASAVTPEVTPTPKDTPTLTDTRMSTDTPKTTVNSSTRSEVPSTNTRNSEIDLKQYKVKEEFYPENDRDAVPVNKHMGLALETLAYLAQNFFDSIIQPHSSLNTTSVSIKKPEVKEVEGSGDMYKVDTVKSPSQENDSKNLFSNTELTQVLSGMFLTYVQKVLEMVFPMNF